MSSTPATIDKQIDETIIEFNKKINDIIVKLEARARDDMELSGLDRVRQRLKIVRAAGVEQTLILAGPYLMEYREQIKNRDETFFTNLDFKKQYGDKIEKDDEFIFGLIESVKITYNSSPQADKDMLYTDVRSLFNAYVKYLIQLKTKEAGGK